MEISLRHKLWLVFRESQRMRMHSAPYTHSCSSTNNFPYWLTRELTTKRNSSLLTRSLHLSLLFWEYCSWVLLSLIPSCGVSSSCTELPKPLKAVRQMLVLLPLEVTRLPTFQNQ